MPSGAWVSDPTPPSFPLIGTIDRPPDLPFRSRGAKLRGVRNTLRARRPAREVRRRVAKVERDKLHAELQRISAILASRGFEVRPLIFEAPAAESDVSLEFVDPGDARGLLKQARAGGVVLDYVPVTCDEDLGDGEILRRVAHFTARGLCVVRGLDPGPEIDPSSIPGDRITVDEFPFSHKTTGPRPTARRSRDSTREGSRRDRARPPRRRGR
jgi:hypothetical protein